MFGVARVVRSLTDYLIFNFPTSIQWAIPGLALPFAAYPNLAAEQKRSLQECILADSSKFVLVFSELPKKFLQLSDTFQTISLRSWTDPQECEG